MIGRTVSRRGKAWLLVAVMYVAAGVLAWCVNEASGWDYVRPAQDGPVEPAPEPEGR